MSKLNNFYYAQYASSSDSEPGYDSDSPETWELLKNSPSHAHFINMIKYLNDKEAIHENWINCLCEQNFVTEIKSIVEENCGMRVILKDNIVTFVYKPELHYSTGLFKFKIAFRYNEVLHKWYFSLGYTFLPDALQVKHILRYGTYDPVSLRVLKSIQIIKEMLDAFVKSYVYIFQFIDHAEDKYPDITFQVNSTHTNLKMLLMEKAWPKSIQKLSHVDMLILNLAFDSSFEVDNIDFEYVFSEKQPVLIDVKKMYMDLLEDKINIFFKVPLYEAFTHFMEE